MTYDKCHVSFCFYNKKIGISRIYDYYLVLTFTNNFFYVVGLFRF